MRLVPIFPLFSPFIFSRLLACPLIVFFHVGLFLVSAAL